MRSSIVTAIGYLAYALEEGELTVAQVDDILRGLVLCLNRESPDVLKAASVAAMSNVIPHCSDQFQDSRYQVRDQVMAAIFEAVLLPNPDVRVKAIECIADVAANFYSALKPYMVHLFTITTNAMQDARDDVVVMAIEFWNQVAEMEADIVEGETVGVENQFYIKLAAPRILPAMFELMTR